MLLCYWSPASRQQVNFKINFMAEHTSQNYFRAFSHRNQRRIKKVHSVVFLFSPNFNSYFCCKKRVHGPKRLFNCMYNKFRCSSHFMVRKMSIWTAQSSLNLHFLFSIFILMQSFPMNFIQIRWIKTKSRWQKANILRHIFFHLICSRYPPHRGRVLYLPFNGS